MKTSLNDYFKGLFGTVENSTESQLEMAGRLIIEFGAFVDMYAKQNHSSMHHVYEFGMVGSPDGRLFALKAAPVRDGVLISYQFLPSVVPNENGHVFREKARVMESGEILSFTTESAVPIEDSFRTGTFVFKPGGEETTGAFAQLFITFFASRRVDIQSGKLGNSATYAGGVADGRKILDSIRG